MTAPALRLTDVQKSFGPTAVIMGVSLDVTVGSRHAIIGPNGAGKTTLFNLVSGRFPLSAGQIELHGRRIDGLPPHEITRRGLSRSFQVTSIFPRMSVFENVRCGLLWSRGYRYSFWHILGRERTLNEAAERLLADVNLEARRDRAQRRERDRARALPDQPARPLAQLPGHQHLSAAVGVGERALRRAVVARIPLFVLARHRRSCRCA